MSFGHEHNKKGMMIFIIDHSSPIPLSDSRCPTGPEMGHPSIGLALLAWPIQDAAHCPTSCRCSPLGCGIRGVSDIELSATATCGNHLWQPPMATLDVPRETMQATRHTSKPG